jgi:hypothetical protein
MRSIAAITGVVLCAGSATFGQSSDAILDLPIKKDIITQREANEGRVI